MNVAGGASAHGAPLGETIAEAFANLRVQGRRSALALLGILIGTASIVAMLNIGHIAERETLKLFSRMGIDMVQISAVPSGLAPAGMNRRAIERLPARNRDILSATPLAVGRSFASAGARQADLSLLAVTPGLAGLAGLSPRQGRWLVPLDDCAQSAVLGERAAAKLSGPGARIVPGSRVVIGGYAYTIVGILAPMAAETLNPADYNDAILIPLACARRALPGADPTAALIRLRPGADADAVGAWVVGQLANPASTIQALNARAIVATMNAQKAVHNRMLAAIGAISLLVGGIGVMNVMLMSVMERRREIGVRAAIGAAPRDLQTMFVIEAGVLALAGGIAGALFGVGAAFFIAKASGWTFSLALYVLPLGAGVAGLVGLVFGLYPAFTAARLDPIEALRAE